MSDCPGLERNEATTTTTMSDKRVRLFFMCIPRSGSTSILKCLSFIDGTEAWFEPYVIAKIAMREYELYTGQELPMDWSEANAGEFDKAAERVQKMNNLPLVDGKKYAFSDVKQSIENSTSPIVVVKDMSISFRGRFKYLPSRDQDYKYVFIIRHPALAISSYRRASIGSWKKLGRIKVDKPVEEFNLEVDDPYYGEAGGRYQEIHAAWKHVRENLDPNPLVIDTDDFLSDPKSYVRKVCEVAGLEYHDGLLQWDASDDIVFSWKNPGGVPKMLSNSLGDFHQTAIHSSCFMKQMTRKAIPPIGSLTPDVQRAVKQGLETYEEMFSQRFKP